ncbi:probable protein phosphatase 2C 60 isoform X2 [Rhodamnia argentea]|uniref:protein-serine/threonine phosphatase n=1 Tax=Rhodamnia argentea TaxID=178133 RepID=A0ABM3GSV4_9MYRT|nr:probable protein phosphatase 2C 60 isoform X2 [Rhodamnia argentea]
MVSLCWGQPFGGQESREYREVGRRFDGLMWSKSLGSHAHGEFSMAVVQANNLLEDQSQLESGQLSFTDSGPFGTFVGICDGHGGSEASWFIRDNLFCNIKKLVSKHQEVSANVIKKAFLATEEGFLSMVKKNWHNKPHIASAGSCCLVGVISNGTLIVGNAGDSRAILGRAVKNSKRITPLQLSEEHNVNFESVREEVRSLHPHDQQIVMLKHKVWRVKGLIQVSRSIGDAYLKRTEFNREPLPCKFRLPEPFLKPILSSEPSVSVHRLQPEDHFLIFASDGLWEHLSNQGAIDIVKNYPRKGIARRLIEAALKEAAKKREIRYSDMKRIESGVRRHFHDNISVAVLFLDPQLASTKSSLQRPVSIKGEGWASAPYC